ncbi:MAG: MFS transporter [Marinilabiliales bacterium]|nr:MAG: MFS transporter [Marinilabiliales bacterium]
MTKQRINIITISSIVALGGFLMGFDASVISGVVKFIVVEFDLTDFQLGWGVSSLTLAATLSMLVSGKLSDKFGRRKVLTYAAILYAVSAIISAFAPSFFILVIARMIGGLGVGASLIIAPMYIAEISPAKMRGMMVSFNQLNIVVGISVAFFTNYLILQWSQSDSSFINNFISQHNSWRWMLGIEAIPALIYFISLFMVPKSPRWLIMKGKPEEAGKVLSHVIGEDESIIEVENIKRSIEKDKNKKQGSFGEIFNKSFRTVLIIGIVLALLQQLVGINAVFFYAPMIFEQSGFGTNAAFSQAIIVGLTNLVFTVLAMFLIDKIGRKLLLIVGTLGIALSMIVISYGFSQATYTIKQNTLIEYSQNTKIEKIKRSDGKIFSSEEEFSIAVKKLIGSESFIKNKSAIIASSINVNTYLILISIMAFVASFAVSVGPVMWVMFSELFPNVVRAVAMSFVGVINSSASFMVQLVFPWELSNLGSSITFLLYGLIAILGLIFILIKVPETKGKTLEELEELLTN